MFICSPPKRRSTAAYWQAPPMSFIISSRTTTKNLRKIFSSLAFAKLASWSTWSTLLSRSIKAPRTRTAQIRELAAVATLKYVSDTDKLADALRTFLRMYRPHEAREDTVLFPIFRSIVSPHEYDALGEDFEKKEDELFGEDGFFKGVDQVAALEKKLGIYDLAQFTPK